MSTSKPTSHSFNQRINEYGAKISQWFKEHGWLSGILSGLFVVLIVILIPKFQLYENESLDFRARIELEDRLRKTLVQIFGGIFVLIGLYLG